MGTKITLDGLQPFRFQNTGDHYIKVEDVEKAFGLLRRGMIEFEGRGKAYYEGDPIVDEIDNDIVVGLVNITFETSRDKIGLGLINAVNKKDAEKVIYDDVMHILLEKVIKPALKHSQSRREQERDVA